MPDNAKYDLSKASSSSDLDDPAKKSLHPWLWRVMLLCGVIIYGSYPVLVHLCEEKGKLPFSTASLGFLIEGMKLCICVCCLMPDILAGSVEWPSFASSLPFAVPALCYCFNNNISLHMQLQMDAATYQVLSNLKILSTALLYKLIIKRPISGIQWFSLFLLLSAGVSNSYAGFQSEGKASPSHSTIHITPQGLLMMAVYCLVSGLAGVYSEYLLKQQFEISIHLQNGMLYIYGVLLNGAIWVYICATSEDQNESWNPFQGFSLYTWTLVLTNSVIGLIMSVIMKHGSNITRLFLISSAMVVTTLLSVVIFNLQLNIYFSLAFILVISALMLYHNVCNLSS